MKRAPVQFTIRRLMIALAVIAAALGGGITAVKWIRLSRSYASRALAHGRSEGTYRRTIDSFDSRFLAMPRSGGALEGYAYHELPAEHHRALRVAYQRAAMRPWETLPVELPEPPVAAIQPQLGRRLIQLAVKHRLKDLDFSNMRLSDDDLADLARCRDLLSLDLSGNPITDRGVWRLRGLDQLRRLNLYKTRVTDAVLPSLRGMKELMELGLYRTGVTQAGLESLKRELPRVDISSDSRLN